VRFPCRGRALRARISQAGSGCGNNSGTVLVPAVSVLSLGSVAAWPAGYRSGKAMFTVR
jgi:hypothetical protein